MALDADKLPAEKQSLLQKIGTGLLAVSEGGRGRGQEFLAGREQQRQQLSLERQEAVAEDLRRAKLLLDQGDVAGVRDLLTQRAQMILQLNGDPTETLDLLNISERALQGDKTAFGRLGAEINAGLQSAADAGIIDLAAAGVPRTPLGKIEADFRAGFITKAEAEQQRKTALAAKVPENFEAVFDKDGNIVAQRNTVTGKIIADPRVPKGPLVEFTLGEDKGAEEESKIAGTRIQEIFTNASAAQGTKNQIASARADLNRLKGTPFESGFFAPLAQVGGEIAVALGASTGIANAVAASEDFEAITGNLTLVEAQKMKGPQSNKELDFARRATARLGSTDLGNRFILDRMEALADREQILADFVDEEQAKGIGRSAVRRNAEKRMESVPYISSVLVDRNGSPIFFTQFVQLRRDDAADAGQPKPTIDEIKRTWRALEKAKRAQ